MPVRNGSTGTIRFARRNRRLQFSRDTTRPMGVLGAAVDTFGPFLIPAVLFVVGVVFYALLWWIGQVDR